MFISLYRGLSLQFAPSRMGHESIHHRLSFEVVSKYAQYIKFKINCTFTPKTKQTRPVYSRKWDVRGLIHTLTSGLGIFS